MRFRGYAVDYSALIGLTDFVGTLVIVSLVFHQQNKSIDLFYKILSEQKDRDLERWKILVALCKGDNEVTKE